MSHILAGQTTGAPTLSSSSSSLTLVPQRPRDPHQACHGVLRDVRLVRRISRSLRFSQLPALARISRLISPAILCEIWEILPTAIPLLRLIPGNYFMNGKWYLSRYITSAHLSRFDAYAPFVKKFMDIFACYIYPSPQISTTAFNVLARLRPRVAVLPMLCSIDLASLRHPHNLILSPFLSTHLQEASVHVPNELCSYAEDLYDHSPNLTRLSISGHITVAASLAILSFARLVDLAIEFSSVISAPDDQSPSALTFLLVNMFDLSSLENFKLDVPHCLSSLVVTHTAPPRLKSVHISGSPSSVQAYLSSTQDLEEIVIKCAFQVWELFDWDRCCAIIRETSGDTLISIRLEPIAFISLQMVIPYLLHLSAIQSFEVDFRYIGFCDIQDNTISRVVGTWRALRKFILPTFFASSQPYSLTTQSLGALAKLPDLAMLRIIVESEVARLPLDPLGNGKGQIVKYMKEVFAEAQLRG